MKTNINYFQISKWMLQTVRAEKVDEKHGVMCSFHVFFLSYGLWIVQNVHFLQFCADLSLKPKSVKTIYIYESECFYCGLSENDIVYRGQSHRSWDIGN